MSAKAQKKGGKTPRMGDKSPEDERLEMHRKSDAAAEVALKAKALSERAQQQQDDMNQSAAMTAPTTKSTMGQIMPGFAKGGTVKKTRKYAEGGFTYDEEVDPQEVGKARVAEKDAEYAAKTTPAAPASEGSFKDAFAAARKAGDKQFTWKGKKYTTEMAGSKPAAKPSKPDTSDFAALKSAGKPVGTSRKGFYEDANRDLVEGVKSIGRRIMGRASEDDEAERPMPTGPRGGRSSSGESMKPLSRFKKGGSVKGWGKARGGKSCKVV